MNQIYSTVYNKTGESIAIVLEEFAEEFMKKIPNILMSDNYLPESINQWYQISSKGKVIMKVSKLEYASSVLIGEFYSDRIRDN
jgi:hypothetical protein